MSSCETPRHSTNVMTPFSRAPLNLTIALFIAALSWVWRSCRSFFPRCTWTARESFDWTRGTTPTHTPPTPRLVWLSSISLSGWVPNGSSHCSRCPTPPPCVCVCKCIFFPFILDIKFVGRTSRGHTGGRSHRIFHPLSYRGDRLCSL